jgi:transcriptional regulator with XRE-family HTH domain
MDDRRVGRIIREVRIRKAWRQVDLAEAAGLSRSTVSDIENGRLDAVALMTLRKVAHPLDIRISIDAWWRAGDSGHLLDAGHAALVEYVVRLLGAAGWETRVEVSFNHYGERGSADIVAWHPGERMLMIVEVKTRIVDVQELIGTFGRKVRILPDALRRDPGWHPRRVVRLLVVPGSPAERRIVRDHAATVATMWPARTAAIRSGVRHPLRMPEGGVWFVPPPTISGRTARVRMTRRVRVPMAAR